MTFAVVKVQNPPTMGDFLTVSQAADEIGITRQAVQQLIDSERLYAVWMLERWAIPAAEVKKYKREKEQKKATVTTNGNGK